MFYPVTTQQSVVVGVCGAERSQVLVKFLVRTASRGEPLFRSSRPDYIETLYSRAFPCRHRLIVPVFQTGLH